MGKQGHAALGSAGQSVRVAWRVAEDAVSFLLNELTQYILHLAQVTLEEIPKKL